MNDKLILELGGNIPLDLFATAVTEFSGLVGALSDEVSDDEAVSWEIDELRSGSAVIEVRPRSDDVDAVDRIVRAYDEVGESLARAEPVPFSQRVSGHAHRLVDLLNGHIHTVRLQTRYNTFAVTERKVMRSREATEAKRPAWGEVHGEVGAIIRRPRLQLTVYDDLFDRGVACYLRQEWRGRVDSLWGRVVVTGLVYRDPVSDRPVKVRDVQEVRAVQPPNGDWQRARGVIPWQPGDEPAEVSIRRVRDASITE